MYFSLYYFLGVKNMRKIIIALIIGLLCIPIASATSVDRALFCNIEGYPGIQLEENILLTSTSSADRIGYWGVFYKAVEGDNEKMNITSWIEIEPKDYTLKPGESKSFKLIIRIPENAEPGLYGAISEDANIVGHSGERRTYIRFKDADVAAAVKGEGSVAWTAFRIPVSVKVLGEPLQPKPPAPVIKLTQENITAIALIAIIIIMLLIVVMLRRRRRK